MEFVFQTEGASSVLSASVICLGPVGIIADAPGVHVLGRPRERAIEPSGKHLSVIGAGPKGVAIAAKRHVLADVGFSVPDLQVFDCSGVGTYWRGGEHGYTDGAVSLGTPPEKDVGFPYSTEEFERTENKDIDTRMLEFSWAAFKVAIGPHRFSEWIDRGRPAPPHRAWAEYLRWVSERIDLQIDVRCLVEINLRKGRWLLGFDSGDPVATDGLVITGPGPPKQAVKPPVQRDRYFDGTSFWRLDCQGEIRKIAEDTEATACVIGSGETSAAIVAFLTTRYPRLTVEVVNREGIIYTRGESFEENRLYSDPRQWREFPRKVRKDFVSRTDRGVFSVLNKTILDKAERVGSIPGDVRKIESVGDQLQLEFKPVGSRTYDLVVDATGFQVDWFLRLMRPDARDALAGALGTRVGRRPTVKKIEAAIGHDIAVSGLHPSLHLPMLAGLERGPGFPSLGSLGTLANRILHSYCPPRRVQRP